VAGKAYKAADNEKSTHFVILFLIVFKIDELSQKNLGQKSIIKLNSFNKLLMTIFFKA